VTKLLHSSLDQVDCGLAKHALAVVLCSLFLMNPAFAQSGTLSLSCGTAAGPAEVGLLYTDTCNVTGGAPPYQWSVTLPPGLSYNVVATIPVSTLPPTNTPIAIQITGDPTTAGPYAYTVKVADSTLPAAQIATQTFSGTIAPAGAPAITAIYGAGLSNPPVTQITTSGLITIIGVNFTPAGVTRALMESDLTGGNMLPTNLAQTCVDIGGSTTFLRRRSTPRQRLCLLRGMCRFRWSTAAEPRIR
jgi:hypothetical protein